MLPLAASVLVALAAAAPLFYVVDGTVRTGWSTARDLIFRPRVGELMSNTVWLCVLCTLACVVLGTAAAFAVERTDLPLRRIWAVLFVAPLAVPAFVNAYAWVALRPGMDGVGGAVLITTLSYFPFVYLPVAAVLRTLDPALEETAAALGKGPVAVFARVVLPQLRPALLGGALLVALHTLAEFGALQMLRFPTFTTAILQQYQSSFNGSAATSLAAVLVLLCLTLVTIEVLLRGRARYARVGSGVARRRSPSRLRAFRWPAFAAAVSLTVLAVGVPLYSVTRWLVRGGPYDVAPLVDAAVTTLQLAGLGALVTVLIAFPVAWLAVRHRSWVSTSLERSLYVSSALPGVVVALALVTFSIRWAYGVYQTTALVVVAYAVLFLPRALVNLRAGIAQAPPELDEASKALGQSPLRTFLRVTLPLTAPSVAAGTAFVFLAASTELTATLLLAPTGTHTLATEFWTYGDSVDYGGAAPYAALLIVASIPMTLVLLQQSRKVRTL